MAMAAAAAVTSASFGFQRRSQFFEVQSHSLFCRFAELKIQLKTSSSIQYRLKPVAVIDPELHKVLELASDEELSDLSAILYGKSLFSPVFKSVAPGDGSRLSSSYWRFDEDEEEREEFLGRLESRLLFLAADARSIVRGQRPRYRDVLLQVRTKLQIPCSVKLSTEDLEAEIFLFLLQQSSRDTAETEESKFEKRSWRGHLVAVLKLGGHEMMSTLLKGGSALTMSALQRLMVKELSGKMLVETARYQLAKEALKKGGQLVAAKLESRVTMLAARQLIAGAATRYITIRSTMMLLGPVLWGTFLADVVLTALGTDYLRVVRAIYALAQIRLTRTYGWTMNPAAASEGE